MLIAN